MIKSRFENLKMNLMKKQAEKNMIDDNISRYNKEISEAEKEMELYDKSAEIISKLSLEAKESIISFLEDIVTDAIKFISESDYKFTIEIDDSSKNVKCEFYIEENVNGEVSKQNIKDSCGGGFLDIISTTLRFAYLNLYNEPSLRGPVILDEPGKMVSQNMSIKFAEFIKKLGEDFNRQTIMITHNSNLELAGDNTQIITK